MAIYRGKKTREIVFPLGGIGTGSIGLCGNGSFCDWEIFNCPNKGSYNGCSFLAVRAERGGEIVDARMLMGDLEKEFAGPYEQLFYRGFGFGAERSTMAGLAHFRRLTFRGEFPIATLSFRDEHFPADVTERAFSPFIPTDDKNSSLPVACFEIAFRNTTEETLTYTAALSVENPYSGHTVNEDTSTARMTSVTMRGLPAAGTDAPRDLTIATDSADAFVQPYWYRGAWMDGLTTFMREFSEKKQLAYRLYDTPGSCDNGTVLASVTVAPGKTGRVRLVLSWNNPVCTHYWGEPRDYTWRNYYATLFRDSRRSAAYCLRRFGGFLRRTDAFRRALYSATLPPAVIDAAAANLAVLRSPTVLRLEDGSLWGWEGTHEKQGSCEGSCTHVWAYEYALPFLFPTLERSLRLTEYTYNMKETGEVRFRTPIPREQAVSEANIPALDGQMLGVVQCFREWRLSGDRAFLETVYPLAKRALDFARSPLSRWRWDADGDGILEGRQHHTLDMELFGPSAWLEAIYITALRAAAIMADEMGDEDAALYRRLAENGAAFMEKELWNGAHYIQRVDLTNRALLASFGEDAVEKYWNEEAGEIKYQVANGSALDQMLADFHTALCGLPSAFDPTHKARALDHMMVHNFFPSVREVNNCWRVFTLNDEAGAMICTYPEGGAPAIPLPYAEECMHGFEYAFAGLLLAEGRERDCLAVVRGVRDRYDGEKRNPYNEMECGSHYARSMAAFGLLPLYAGFTFDMTRGHLGFAPRTRNEKGVFAGVFGAANSFGTIRTHGGETRLQLLEGALSLRSLALPEQGQVTAVYADGAPIAFRAEDGVLYFNTTIRHTLTVTYA